MSFNSSYWVNYYLAHYFDNFNDWLSWAANRIGEILSEWDVWSILSTPIEWAVAAYNWVINAAGNIWNVVDDWWQGMADQVQLWINSAIYWLNNLLDDVKDTVNNLWSSLTDFFANILPTLASWTGVSKLIGDTLSSWFPFYDELAATWDGILTFFTDPAKAIYNLFDYVIDRFWDD